MDEPLPADVVERLSSDYGERADTVTAQLLACRRLGSTDYFGDRLVRCVVFVARGDEWRVPDLIELGRQEYRDLILAAEYDPLCVRRLRNFNHPFGAEGQDAEPGAAADGGGM